MSGNRILSSRLGDQRIAGDVNIAAKAMGFLDPPVASGVVAITSAAGNPASHADTVESDPKVDITVHHAAGAGGGGVFFSQPSGC